MYKSENLRNNLVFVSLLVLVSLGFAEMYFFETNIETDEGLFKGMELADMNNDGLYDIVLYNHNGLVVLENNGDGSFSEHLEEDNHMIWNIRHVKTGDMEGDGDIDIFVCGDSQINTLIWYENLGNFNFEAFPIIDNNFTLLFDFVPFDYDYDGDLDFLISALDPDPEVFSRHIGLFLNNDLYNPFNLDAIVNTSLIAQSVKLADFDLDGDRDVIAIGNSSAILRFFRNDGFTPFTGIQLLDTGEDFLFDDLEVIYYDDDEIPDILTTNSFTENIYIYEINDEELDTLEIIETTFNTTNSVTYVDLDFDGDMDILGYGSISRYIVWWERDGNNFIEHVIADGTGDYLKSCDLDNDGKLEIVSAGNRYSISIWEEGPPHTIVLIPYNEWQVIFPVGGILPFDVNIQNLTDLQFQSVAWTEVIAPGGLTIGPLASYPFVVDPFDVLEVTPWLDVPGWVPGGYYTLVANIGSDLENPIDSDSLVFLKLGADPNAGEFENWAVSGWDSQISDIEFVPSNALPDEYAIENIYPNPFNPRTEISVNLPESSKLQLEVFDLLGRQVMTLADGHFSDGNHKFTFDGTGLSSGVYLVKMNVPGKFSSMEKMVLMK